MKDIVQSDFHEEGKHQWALNHKGYRVVVRKLDGDYEIIIKAEIHSDPEFQDWERALEIINKFYRDLNTANRDVGNL